MRPSPLKERKGHVRREAAGIEAPADQPRIPRAARQGQGDGGKYRQRPVPRRPGARVVPLTRAEHEAYDRGELDLLPYLLAHGLVAELQHALGHARADLLGLLNLITGERFAPERTAA
jgi:hypothetical protein